MASTRKPKHEITVAHDPDIASAETHTMGKSLFEYLRMKVHPDIQDRDWSSIIVKGHHIRSHPSRIANIEKVDKPFNWQRPTTVQVDNDTLELRCFPGRDYVQHYAAIIGTYLNLKNRSTDVVTYYMPSPSQCMEPLLESNLKHMPPVDIAIIGYVHHLKKFTSGTWEYGSSSTTSSPSSETPAFSFSENSSDVASTAPSPSPSSSSPSSDSDSEKELFAWQIHTMPNGTRIAFIGCRICFWGDIGGNVVRTLQQLQSIKCAIYVGKLGSLRPEHRPNAVLATGSSSYVNGAPITWSSVLSPYTQNNATIFSGRHYSLPSVLQETKTWFQEKQEFVDFVEPEIGHMAKASLEGGTRFGYLHVISDNLARKYQWDLSNEREEAVQLGREGLFREIEGVLGRFFEGWDEGKGREGGRLV